VFAFFILGVCQWPHPARAVFVTELSLLYEQWGTVCTFLITFDHGRRHVIVTDEQFGFCLRIQAENHFDPGPLVSAQVFALRV
jgi:hypothetical protein